MNPGGRVRRLEQRLRFADTFENRVALADAYLAATQTDKAIAPYEQSLTGVFSENEQALMHLMMAYAQSGRHADTIPLGRKVYHSPQFARSPAHITYAKALEATGKTATEEEFKKMKSRFSAFEPRYHYGLFLLRTNRPQDAKTMFTEMLDEEKHLSGRKKRFYRTWFIKAGRR